MSSTGSRQLAQAAQALIDAAVLEQKREDLKVAGAVALALLDIASAVREHTEYLQRQAVAPRAFGPR